MGGAPIIETIRPGVQFTPAAAASFRRAEASWRAKTGRQFIDCNSTYRDYNTQLRMYNDWNAYVAGRGPKPNHSRAIHPDASIHCRGEALDSDDWVIPGFIAHMAHHGWIRTAASDPTERHHFEYQSWRDNHRNETALADDEIPKEWDEMATKEEIAAVVAAEITRISSRPSQSDRTVHVRTEGAMEWTLGDALVGADLEQFDGIVTAANRRDAGDGVFEFRGFLVTGDPVIGQAWSRIYARGNLGEHSRTDRTGYVAIQRELSRVATAELSGQDSAARERPNL